MKVNRRIINSFLGKKSNGEKIGVGTATSKKKAEQLASQKALMNLGVIVNGEIDYKWTDKIEKIEKIEKEKVKRTKNLSRSIILKIN